jgi:hypothetical protein
MGSRRRQCGLHKTLGHDVPQVCGRDATRTAPQRLVAIEHPLRCLRARPDGCRRILARVLSGKAAPWQIMSWRESIEAVLRHALGSGREDAKHEAEQLTHRLGRAGYFELRDVLRGMRTST